MPGIQDVLAGKWGRWGYRLQLVRHQQQNGDTLFNIGTVFTFKSLKKATKNFSNQLLLRQGGYTSCYKGTLENGSIVAVKVLNEFYRSDFDFFSVMRTMSRISHRNVVEFIGYCIEGNHRMIVYEFVGDDLKSFLFRIEGETQFELSWPRRASICLGIARGIEYLHRGISPRIVHCDIKLSNILLDDNLNPKITDFEIAHTIDDALSECSGSVVGTFGYMDPEFLVTGKLTEKVDVYGFGILLLEVITGRMYFEFLGEGSHLVDWVWGLRDSDRVLEIVDPRLSEVPEEEVVRFINTALFCVQQSSNLRPTMFEVLLMLSGGYDFSRKVLTNNAPLPVPDSDLMYSPAHGIEDEDLLEEELCR